MCDDRVSNVWKALCTYSVLLEDYLLKQDKKKHTQQRSNNNSFFHLFSDLLFLNKTTHHINFITISLLVGCLTYSWWKSKVVPRQHESTNYSAATLLVPQHCWPLSEWQSKMCQFIFTNSYRFLINTGGLYFLLLPVPDVFLTDVDWFLNHAWRHFLCYCRPTN